MTVCGGPSQATAARGRERTGVQGTATGTPDGQTSACTARSVIQTEPNYQKMSAGRARTSASRWTYEAGIDITTDVGRMHSVNYRKEHWCEYNLHCSWGMLFQVRDVV